MKKIKIIHVLHCVGGVETSLRLILKNIDPEKYESIVIHGLMDTSSPFEDKNGASVKEYKIPIYRNISLWNDLIALYRCYSILKHEKPRVIHAHSAKGGIIGRVIGRLLGIKVLFTPQAFSYLSETKGLKRNIFLKIERFFANANSLLLASSQSELERGINEVGYKRENTLLFNNCINPILSVSPLTIEKTWPDRYICTVGRPCYQKNIDFMIKAFSEIKDSEIHLVVMGVGHHVDQLDIVERLIAKLGLKDRVTLLKWTSREDVLHIINKAELYISTARYEGLPYAVIESLALAKACIVTDCDGNRDLISNGFNGYVVQGDDYKVFGEAVSGVLKDDHLKASFGNNAREHFMKYFNIETNVSAIESIYDTYK
ncbi:glycosyltransferase [Flavobacterium sp.]|uniref:glycosyltransferase n=1 Tax=Flavobacterium sp. TaxID=239 RepID=UPI002636E70E|nr:glycosyltransferase [Flavobacterium sp.]